MSAGVAPAGIDVPDTAYRFAQFELQPASRELLVEGTPARIGGRAFDLLLALVEARGRTLSRDQLFERVWPGRIVEDQNLRVQVTALRRLLGDQAIATIPGRGYRFVLPLIDPDVAAAEAPATGVTVGAAPQDAAVAAPSSRAPVPPAPLFGRVSDIAAVYRLVESRRLVTITGPGGIGKTRLAQAVAHQLQPHFADRVFFVELAALANEATLVPTVAHALGLTPDRGLQTVAELAGAVASLHGLLVLDNGEHLVAAVAALVTALQRAAPRLTVLVTTQEPLRIAGEQIYRLDPLGLPDETASLEQAAGSGAVALFVARVQALSPRFALDASNVAAVVDICRRLDGIALALELAAARVPVLGVDAVRARLDERLQLLAGSRRDLPARHRTLRGALAWSHHLLSREEQRVFRRLAVFSGSVGLALLREVLAEDGDEWALLDHLGSLIDKSLVLVDGEDAPRYRLLESTRAFALEQLAAAGELDTWRERHARALCAAWRAHEIEGFGRPALVWQAEHLPDLDNLRAALDWCCAAPARRDLGAALLAHTMRLWLGLGLSTEARGWAIALQAHADGAPSGHATDALAIAFAMLALNGADGFAPAPALQRLDEVLDRYAEEPVRQYVLLHVRYALRLRLDPNGERGSDLARMRALERADWPPLLTRFRRMNEAQEDYLAGRTEAYLAFCREDCALCRRLGAVSESWVSARHVLLAEYQAGRLERALTVGAELFAAVRAAARLRQNNVTVGIWSWMLAEHGDIATARAALAELLPIARGERTVWRVGLTLAWVALHEGHAALAARVLAWYDAQVQAVGQGVHGPASERSRQRLLARLATALTADALARAQAGAATVDEEALLDEVLTPA